MIRHNKPNISNNSIKAAKLSLSLGKLTTGDKVKKFEDYFSRQYYKTGYAAIVSSGTAALYLAIKSLDIKKKKPRILVPTYACSAVLNAIYLANCIPVISDIDKDNFTISTNKKFENIDIIIAVNIFGSLPKLKRIKQIYPKSKIILDACHSIGMKVKKNSEIFVSDIIIHSFYSTKIITCGHGGLIWSKHKKYINFCKDYINFDVRNKYKQRFNFLLTDFQVAMLFDQLQRIEQIRKFRIDIFSNYKKSIGNDINIFEPFNLKYDIVYRSILIFDSKDIRNKFQMKFLKNNVESIIPVKKFELLHNYIGLDKKKFMISENICDKTLSLPMHTSLKKKEIQKVCSLLKNI